MRVTQIIAVINIDNGENFAQEIRPCDLFKLCGLPAIASIYDGSQICSDELNDFIDCGHCGYWKWQFNELLIRMMRISNF